ncbi:site-specific DNA-methyltransferase [ANME-1 cluster archaeon ex4572_4]|nr:MAG: site-specific DNA-methyltransferase [ANME-1 cluster archaeon ex4572_4]PXF50917.1 MAG: site-specific DNA-methyltransferase [Methanophagales archaeon]HDN68706.1 site-specific DNA-methyltransferase [Methanomicrobia archaeon]
MLEVDKIYCGDALVLAKSVPEGAVDLVVTDPPFGIEFAGRRPNYHRTAERVLEGYNEIPKADYLDFTVKWMREARRVLKETGSLYVFSGWTNLKEILVAADKVGFETLNHLIWKYQFGVFTKRKFVTSHYHILLVVKNPRKYKFNKIEHYPEDVLVVNREYWRGKEKTATKLPVKLVRKLILFSSDEGDLVLDLFAGSGTTAVACKATNRRFIGFEIVPEYVDFANERLSIRRLSVCI